MALMNGSEAVVADRRWTVEDLAQIDDDNDHYELVDGRIDVSPPPNQPHPRAAARLAFHLTAIALDDVEIVIEAGVVLNSERTHYRIPDLSVVQAGPITTTQIEHPPLLAVEIMSPDSTFRDHHTKRREYASFDIPSYWVVNPSLEMPGLIEFRLRGGDYEPVTEMLGDDTFTTDTPFPISLVPRWLVADGPWKQRIGGGG